MEMDRRKESLGKWQSSFGLRPSQAVRDCGNDPSLKLSQPPKVWGVGEAAAAAAVSDGGGDGGGGGSPRSSPLPPPRTSLMSQMTTDISLYPPLYTTEGVFFAPTRRQNLQNLSPTTNFSV